MTSTDGTCHQHREGKGAKNTPGGPVLLLTVDVQGRPVNEAAGATRQNLPLAFSVRNQREERESHRHNIITSNTCLCCWHRESRVTMPTPGAPPPHTPNPPPGRHTHPHLPQCKGVVQDSLACWEAQEDGKQSVQYQHQHSSCFQVLSHPLWYNQSERTGNMHKQFDSGHK